MGSFSSLIFGSNPTLNTDVNNAGDLSTYGSNTGEGATNTANSFYQDILSGDPSKIGQVLSPQIKAIQDQGQQKKNTNAQFGNRSGGTNATNQTTDDNTRRQVNNLVSNLTGQAVTGEQNIGSEGLTLGLNANQQQATLAQQQQDDFLNSIFGKAAAGAVNYGESFLPVAGG